MESEESKYGLRDWLNVKDGIFSIIEKIKVI